jgi:hypothetical protein
LIQAHVVRERGRATTALTWAAIVLLIGGITGFSSYWEAFSGPYGGDPFGLVLWILFVFASIMVCLWKGHGSRKRAAELERLPSLPRGAEREAAPDPKQDKA